MPEKLNPTRSTTTSILGTPFLFWRMVAVANLGLGIGRFTIFDKAVVAESDLGVNFFLDRHSIGASRAECCTALLQELNPEVQGDWYPKPDVSPLFPYSSSYCPISKISARLPLSHYVAGYPGRGMYTAKPSGNHRNRIHTTH